MGDFLTRLAERSLGTARVMRPELAPVFAPALTPQRDRLDEFLAAAEQSTVRPAEDNSRASLRTPEQAPRNKLTAGIGTNARTAPASLRDVVQIAEPGEDASSPAASPQHAYMNYGGLSAVELAGSLQPTSFETHGVPRANL